MILVIDNYDSFTYNLVQYLAEMGREIAVFRNDAITLSEVRTLAPEAIIISPGPGTPDDAGISVELIREFASTTPILGVCLGHQAIGRAYSAGIKRARTLMHGKTSVITHDGLGIYKGLSNPLVGGRYHSLVIDESSLPSCLKVTARADDGTIMGVRHKLYPVEGVQFHPESVLTPAGKSILRNFVSQCDCRRGRLYINDINGGVPGGEMRDTPATVRHC
ncbi:MAG TPA: aminodeoxychorismate/anthranilate synthase component II [Firmicutes bacterium]|nr:aminodeoxychorismate/anthranilate synthase component II [Bacillota bacterium]